MTLHPRTPCPVCGKPTAVLGAWPDQYRSHHAGPDGYDCAESGVYLLPCTALDREKELA